MTPHAGQTSCVRSGNVNDRVIANKPGIDGADSQTRHGAVEDRVLRFADAFPLRNQNDINEIGNPHSFKGRFLNAHRAIGHDAKAQPFGTKANERGHSLGEALTARVVGGQEVIHQHLLKPHGQPELIGNLAIHIAQVTRPVGVKIEYAVDILLTRDVCKGRTELSVLLPQQTADGAGSIQERSVQIEKDSFDHRQILIDVAVPRYCPTC